MIAYLGKDDRLRCAAFILSQEKLLNDLESLDLDPFRIYQVSLAELARKTELNFDLLSDADIISRPELVTRPVGPESLVDTTKAVTEIRSERDIRL